ncbi:MAG: protein-disulfide reductase DsbD domain-containing protein [Acidobacteriaceae bacterium]
MQFAVLMMAAAALWAVCCPVARAQEPGQEPAPVAWTLAASAGSPLGRGAVVTARLHASIEPGWHIYSLHEERGGPTAMRISVPARAPFAISGDFDAPTPRTGIDPGFGMETHFYTGEVAVRIPLRATRKTDGPVAVDVFYQACNRETCLRPTVAHLTAAVTRKQEEKP